MIAGTLVVVGRSGPLPGYLMRRGTIVLGDKAVALSPTFIDCGVHDLIAARLMAGFIGGCHARPGHSVSPPPPPAAPRPADPPPGRAFFLCSHLSPRLCPLTPVFRHFAVTA